MLDNRTVLDLQSAILYHMNEWKEPVDIGLSSTLLLLAKPSRRENDSEAICTSISDDALQIALAIDLQNNCIPHVMREIANEVKLYLNSNIVTASDWHIASLQQALDLLEQHSEALLSEPHVFDILASIDVAYHWPDEELQKQAKRENDLDAEAKDILACLIDIPNPKAQSKHGFHSYHHHGVQAKREALNRLWSSMIAAWNTSIQYPDGLQIFLSSIQNSICIEGSTRTALQQLAQIQSHRAANESASRNFTKAMALYCQQASALLTALSFTITFDNMNDLIFRAHNEEPCLEFEQDPQRITPDGIKQYLESTNIYDREEAPKDSPITPISSTISTLNYSILVRSCLLKAIEPYCNCEHSIEIAGLQANYNKLLQLAKPHQAINESECFKIIRAIKILDVAIVNNGNDAFTLTIKHQYLTLAQRLAKLPEICTLTRIEEGDEDACAIRWGDHDEKELFADGRLWCAIRDERHEEYDYLLEHSPLDENSLEQSILYMMSQSKPIDITLLKKMLDKKKLNLNRWRFSDMSNSTLHMAVINNHCTAVPLLCQYEANLFEPNLYGSSAIDLALQEKNVAMIKAIDSAMLAEGQFSTFFSTQARENWTHFFAMAGYQSLKKVLRDSVISEEAVTHIIEYEEIALFDWLEIDVLADVIHNIDELANVVIKAWIANKDSVFLQRLSISGLIRKYIINKDALVSVLNKLSPCKNFSPDAYISLTTNFISEREGFLETCIQTPGDLYEAIQATDLIRIFAFLSFEHMMKFSYKNATLNKLADLVRKHESFSEIESKFNDFQTAQRKKILFDLAASLSKKTAESRIKKLNKGSTIDTIISSTVDENTLGIFLSSLSNISNAAKIDLLKKVIAKKENFLNDLINSIAKLQILMEISGLIQIFNLLSFGHLVLIPCTYEQVDALTTFVRKQESFEDIAQDFHLFRDLLLEEILRRLVITLNEKPFQERCDMLREAETFNILKNCISDGRALGKFLLHLSESLDTLQQDALLESLVNDQGNLFELTIKASAKNFHNAITVSNLIHIITIGLSHEHMMKIAFTPKELKKITQFVRQHRLFRNVQQKFDFFLQDFKSKDPIIWIADDLQASSSNNANFFALHQPSNISDIKTHITDGLTLGKFLVHFNRLSTIADQNVFLMNLPKSGSLSFLETILKLPKDIYNAIAISGWITILLAIHLSPAHVKTLKYTEEEHKRLYAVIKHHVFFQAIKPDFDKLCATQGHSNLSG